ncbi:putative expansin-B2 [Impatiens glandulifera]|uniref:putative expansin-B2 n=1 Tax=Impatiens glandulifera TaxID=253017 RepID=UPI001FB1579F|nr:putative expansin-B2 [Impatiens glandulifera]
MANYHYSSFLPFLFLIFLGNSVYAFNPRFLNVTSRLDDSQWSMARATWYGSPDGAGSDGGACGYQNAVDMPPFSSMVSAGGPSLYVSGKGCGGCYQVKCTSDQNSACSGNPVTVVITDECPSCDSTQFDLSGTAFGAMAKSGMGQQLRNAGTFNIHYDRVPCNFPGKTLTFRVDAGSNQNFFSTLIEYENGEGNLLSVEVKEALDSVSWKPMQQSWGAVWKVDSGSPLMAPLSLKLRSSSGQTIVARNVIPVGWKPGMTYRAMVNFV